MPSVETANVGKAVAKRVGDNIREVRTKLGMTQAQLAAPEFSISYISAIERGKIRPSLKALSILARRLDVPLTFLSRRFACRSSGSTLRLVILPQTLALISVWMSIFFTLMC